MEQLLKPISTRTGSNIAESSLEPVNTASSQNRQFLDNVDSAEDALNALSSKPDAEILGKILRWLSSTVSKTDGFNVLRPSPKVSQIVYVLVNEIIPVHWMLLKDEDTLRARKIRQRLLKCLRSSSGCGALVSRLKFQIDELKSNESSAEYTKGSNIQSLETSIDVLEHILSPSDLLATLWDATGSYSLASARASLLWKEVISLFGSGKLLSLVGEANQALNAVSPDVRSGSWIGKGQEYASWLGRNLNHMINASNTDGNENTRKAVSQCLSKMLTLGYPVQVVEAACSRLLCGDKSLIKVYKAILVGLPGREQKLFLYSVIRVLSQQHSLDKKVRLGGSAALISGLCTDVLSLQDDLVGWLIGTSPEAVGQDHDTQRAVVLALSSDLDCIKSTLWKALELFGDKLFIKHTPILHQEVNTQILLLLAGHAHRKDGMFLKTVSKSSVYLNGISNHLAASSARARFLGMVVGSSISHLVDEPSKRLNFQAEDSESVEWRWYKALISLSDRTGSITDLRPPSVAKSEKPAKEIKQPATSLINNSNSTNSFATSKAASKIIRIEEIASDSESEDDDLPAYAKPDIDPSDDDEDPTLVQRNKPSAPVYILDLISGLRDTENFDKHTLALKNASSLIRRKATFGTEVTDPIEELAGIFVGLKDRWELEGFTKYRLQAMLAILIAEPLRMGQWYSRTFYNGDYSLGQRVSILTTLGLGAREIAGVGKDDATLTGAAASKDAFPSKRLPEKLHNLYGLEAAPMDALSTQLERAMIQPLAASAADKVTGPNALKVRTFSSRMDVEKKRQKPLPNALAKIVAEGFFFPLTGRWQIQVQAFGNNAPQSSPMLLSHLLKTLSLILHAAGPSTLSLPEMTSEFWSFLLHIRSSSRAADPIVLEALLFSFLTLLDVNSDNQRRLAEEHAKELLETQEWTGNLLERLGGGDEEGERCRMLAAGVLLRCREVVEKYQRLLMGDLVDFI